MRRTTAILVLTSFAVAWALPALAQKKQYVITDQRTQKRFLAAQEELQAEQWEPARQTLEGFRTDKASPYEVALYYQMMGFIEANQDRFEEAAGAFQACLDADGLPPEAQVSLRFNLGQIYMMLEQWDDAIATFETWFSSVESPTSSAYYTLASAYYQGGREEEALAPAQKAVELSEEPRENWLQLLYALYLQQDRYADAIPIVEQLVSRFPKKNYWIQLAAMYMQEGREEDSMAVQQLAYAQGLLENDRELTRLAQMYLFNDLPYRAARLMERGLAQEQIEADQEAFQMLGNSWLAARESERAMEPLRQAAALSEDGELWLRLGQVHVQREEWDQAIDAIRNAQEKGLTKGPNTEGHAQVLLGIARFNKKQYTSARGHFQRALAEEKTEKMAESWLTYLERQMAALQIEG